MLKLLSVLLLGLALLMPMKASAAPGYSNSPWSQTMGQGWHRKYRKKNKRKYYKRRTKKKSYKKKGRDVWSGGGKPYIAPKRPNVVAFRHRKYKPGQIVIDTSKRRLYYVLKGKRAYSYPIAVGKPGFSWTGTKRITAKKNWPDWRPPKEMRQRKPNLPKLMKGGVKNPMGAKALYLGSSLYRIHGTNNAKSIGTASSSGCFRMHNSHVTHLSSITGVGTKVHVLRSLGGKKKKWRKKRYSKKKRSAHRG